MLSYCSLGEGVGRRAGDNGKSERAGACLCSLFPLPGVPRALRYSLSLASELLACMVKAALKRPLWRREACCYEALFKVPQEYIESDTIGDLFA